jgi:hypothetical protein
VYRNIWDSNSSESPAVGDYVESNYGKRGIVLTMSELIVYVGVFGEPHLRGCPSVAFTKRWTVCR